MATDNNGHPSSTMPPHRRKKMNPIQRWLTFFYGMPQNPWQYVVSVDLSNVWRRHVVWSKKNGEDLRAIVTGRYSSTNVFLSLLFSTEMAVIYSPSKPADQIRAALIKEPKDLDDPAYWIGIALNISVFFSLCALVANFTAWSIFSSLSKENAPIVLRSNVGLYSAHLPARLTVMALYLFFVVIILTWWLMMPGLGALILTVGAIFVIFHIVQTFSAAGNLVMLTGAMSNIPILDDEEEVKMHPDQLTDELLHRARLAKKLNVSVMRQYRFDYQELISDAEEGRVTLPIPDTEYETRTSRMSESMRNRMLSTLNKDLIPSTVFEEASLHQE